MQSFFIPLASIALAELGDKTQLAVMLLSAKTKKHAALFAGVMAAFFVVDGSAILAGSWITKLIPIFWLKIISGLVFILFGVLTYRSHSEIETESPHKANSPFLLGFGTIFFAELGDKTQIAAGLFSVKYAWPGVLAGTLTALALLSLTAIYAGRWISTKLKPALLKKTAGILFIAIGCSFFLF